MTVWQVIALSAVALQTIPLTLIDIKEHRLPNVWVFPGYGVLAICWIGMFATDSTQLLPSVGGSVGYVLFLMVLSVLGGMGLGDVKLAGVLGGAAGMMSVTTVLESVVWSFVLGAVASIFCVVFLRRVHSAGKQTWVSSLRQHRIAFGPFMLAGFWIAIASATGIF